MHRKRKAELLPLDTEIERTRGLRKVKKREQKWQTKD